MIILQVVVLIAVIVAVTFILAVARARSLKNDFDTLEMKRRG